METTQFKPATRPSSKRPAAPQRLNTPEEVKAAAETLAPLLHQPAPENPAPDFGTNVSDGSHLAGVILPPEPDAAPEPAPSGAAVVDGFLTAEQFAEGLKLSLLMGGGVLGLKTLEAAPGLDTFPAAARALYDLARDTPMLHFLIKPGSIWVQRAMAIGAFAVPLGRAVSAEIAAAQRKPAPRQVQPSSVPVPESSAGAAGPIMQERPGASTMVDPARVASLADVPG